MGVITFNGVSSKDLDILVELIPDYEMPEREYDFLHIPGRSGDIVIDKGSYKNIDREYYIVMSTGKTFVEMSGIISNWLRKPAGYARLEDSYEPEFYRLAAYKSQDSIRNIHNQAARNSVIFNCKPQRFLKSGEYTKVFNSQGSGGVTQTETVNITATKSGVRGITVSASSVLYSSAYVNVGFTYFDPTFHLPGESNTGTATIEITEGSDYGVWTFYNPDAHILDIISFPTQIQDYSSATGGGGVLINPTLYPSKPLIKVYGLDGYPISGTIYIGNYSCVLNGITTMDSSVTIDCEIEEVYNGGINFNNSAVMAEGFLRIDPGTVNVIFTGLGISKIEIIPRWWTL